MMKKITIGTRKSALALWQSEFVKRALLVQFPDLSVELLKIETRGDRTQSSDEPLPEIGGKGLFTLELEEALKEGRIDIAVHSLKDLPTAPGGAFELGAILRRAPSEDVLVTRGQESFWDLPHGATIGTSSLRRAAQVARLRPDLRCVSIRGNVDTRISKVRERSFGFDGTILAQAGIERLGRVSEASYIFAPDEMLPAPGQGALAVQILAQRGDLRDIVGTLHDKETAACVAAERAFLARLQAGCNTPVAALARREGRVINFKGRCLSPTGDRLIEVSGCSDLLEAELLGTRMAEEALDKGAAALISR
ncbi:MAG: hydroxymethylbilane synthase [Deltaproteobacteria bacterium]|nr:hydroxymethylbilane synthase [Deltaproteobacteria bacterium]